MIDKFINKFKEIFIEPDKYASEGDAQVGIKENSVGEAGESDSELQRMHDTEQALNKLSSLVGLEKIKLQIERLTAFAWMSKEREKRGLSNQALSLHMAFKGNPGTGKTTVARILGEILYTAGVLDSSTVTEVSRNDLIGEYIGQSLPKANRVISKAKGGILLIDEAYGLIRSDSARDYGYEVVDHLVKVMEDQRDEIMIIFTGYQKELEDLIESNTGLKSRINFHLVFPDYTKEELLEIFLHLASEKEYDVSQEAIWFLKEYLQPHPDNGRHIRNILEQSIVKKAENMFKSKKTHDLKTLTVEDIVLPEPEIKKGKAGFIK